jgi:hypothetical protein
MTQKATLFLFGGNSYEGVITKETDTLYELRVSNSKKVIINKRHVERVQEC